VIDRAALDRIHEHFDAVVVPAVDDANFVRDSGVQNAHTPKLNELREEVWTAKIAAIVAGVRAAGEFSSGPPGDDRRGDSGVGDGALGQRREAARRMDLLVSGFFVRAYTRTDVPRPRTNPSARHPRRDRKRGRLVCASSLSV
jgi:hypothetical protein